MLVKFSAIFLGMCLTSSCGLTGSRYVDYKSENSPNTTGTPGNEDDTANAAPTFCQQANDSISDAFTTKTTECSCHTATTPPIISGDANADRLEFVRITIADYDGTYADLAAYIKTEGHAGYTAAENNVGISQALDDWVINENSICPTQSDSP